MILCRYTKFCRTWSMSLLLRYWEKKKFILVENQQPRSDSQKGSIKN
eukprot:UN00189